MSKKHGKQRDPWEFLREATHARIALGRAGHSIDTKELLNFRLAHSKARDAVWQEVDFSPLKSKEFTERTKTRVIEVQSNCKDKQHFLLNPNLGRTLAADARAILGTLTKDELDADCALVIADGLSARAVTANALLFAEEFLRGMTEAGFKMAPVILARYGRVALSDDIGFVTRAKSVLMLIGERPGLASADSLSAYFAYGPRPDRTDADRNCISNIHEQGLAPQTAAKMAVFLAKTAFERQLSGVDLKIEYPALSTSRSRN